MTKQIFLSLICISFYGQTFNQTQSTIQGDSARKQIRQWNDSKQTSSSDLYLGEFWATFLRASFGNHQSNKNFTMGGCNQSKVVPASSPADQVSTGKIKNKSFSFWKFLKNRRNMIRVSCFQLLRWIFLIHESSCFHPNNITISQSAFCQSCTDNKIFIRYLICI